MSLQWQINVACHATLCACFCFLSRFLLSRHAHCLYLLSFQCFPERDCVMPLQFFWLSSPSCHFHHFLFIILFSLSFAFWVCFRLDCLALSGQQWSRRNGPRVPPSCSSESSGAIVWCSSRLLNRPPPLAVLREDQAQWVTGGCLQTTHRFCSSVHPSSNSFSTGG